MATTVGLCAHCRHVRLTGNRRGSVFYYCTLSETDARFPKYPPLPVLACAGYAPREDTPPGEASRERG